MKVQVPINLWALIALYLLILAGTGAVGTKLCTLVAKQAIVLALPHLDNNPPKPSLMDQRRIDATLAVPPLPEGEKIEVAALEATPAKILAAQLDLAEKDDLSESALPIPVATAEGSLEPASYPSSIATRVYSYRMRIASDDRPERLTAHSITARDIFNRSFGVQSATPEGAKKP
jgi:hypothetical protein